MSAFALAAKAVAAPGWRWLPGMLDTDGRRVVAVRVHARDGVSLLLAPSGSVLHPVAWVDFRGTAVPDLDDAATIGAIEHGLLPELYGEGCSLWHSPTGWHYGRDGMSFGSGLTKGAALVAALRGAP